MLLQCQDCGTHYTTDFSGDIQSGPCPECGSPRPFRNQPPSTQSDGTVRNLVDSDSQVDQGGNPLGEGTIVGDDGEVPLSTGSRGRDNYMHSHILAALVTSDWFENPDETEPGHGRPLQAPDIQNQPHQPLYMEDDLLSNTCPYCKGHGITNEGYCSHCNATGASQEQPARARGDEGWEEDHRLQESDIPQSLYVNPEILRGRTPQYGKTAAGWMGSDPLEEGKIRCPSCHGELMSDHGTRELLCTNCGNSWPIQGEDSSSRDPSREGLEYARQMGGPPLPNQPPILHPSTEQPGIIFPERGNNFGPRHQGGAMEDILGLNPQESQRPPMMRWEPGKHGRGLIIGGEPHTWNGYDPQNFQTTTDLGPYHGDYVKNLGINPDLVDFGQGVEILPTGEIEHITGRDPTPYIQADPRLKPQENPYTFSYTMTSTIERTSNMEPYEQLWAHEADVAFDKGPDANVPPISFTVNPSEQGIHGAHRKHLAFLDAHVAGQPTRDSQSWDNIYRRFGLRQSPEFGTPVQIQVHDAAHIIPLKSQLEQPAMSTTPQYKEMVNKISNGELAPPPGVDPSTIRVAKIHTAIPALLEGATALMDSPIAGAVMKGALFKGGENMLGMGGGQAQQPPAPEGEEGGTPTNPAFGALAALMMSDYESPMSLPDIGSKPNDPEKADTKEFNDQDKNPSNPNNPNLEDSGASGEDTVRQEQGFAPDSPGMERLNMMLPLIVHYFQSGDAGEDDAMLRSLHETLEAENPGYLDRVTPEDEKRAAEFIQQMGHDKPKDVHAKTAMLPPMQPPASTPLGGDPNAVQQMIQNQVEPQGNIPVQPGGIQQASKCPNCGGVLNGTGACPQCGAGAMAAGNPQTPLPGGMPQGFSHIDVLAALVDSANHQGPVTPEQIAAVQQLLIKENRIDEIPNVPIHPENYVREMAEIQNQPDVAPQVTPQEQTQPPPPAPPGGAPGAMPMPGMGGEPGGQPMQPMSALSADNIARRCPNCGSGTTGMLNGEDGTEFCHACGHQWKGDAIEEKTAADNVARRCPNCHSGTTGLLDGEKGLCFCHACGNQWKLPGLVEEKTAAPIQSPNPTAAPAAEQNLTQVDGNEDSSLTWKDTDGMRLQPGHEYEMHNPNFQGPDMIKVDRVKPDGLDVTLVGTFANDPNSLQHQISLTKEEIDLQGITFKPAVDETQAPESQEGPPGTAAPGQVPPMQTTDEHENSFPNMSSVRSVAEVEEPPDPDTCPKCGHHVITSSMSGPETIMNECYRCTHAWETRDAMEGVEEDLEKRSWLMNNDEDDDFFANMDRMRAMASAGNGGQSRNIGDIAAKDTRAQQVRDYLESEKVARAERTAGRHFTPAEQRALIDEDGTARNSDMLNLSGTHYKHSGEAALVDGDRVPDAHVLLGL